MMSPKKDPNTDSLLFKQINQAILNKWQDELERLLSKEVLQDPSKRFSTENWIFFFKVAMESGADYAIYRCLSRKGIHMHASLGGKTLLFIAMTEGNMVALDFLLNESDVEPAQSDDALKVQAVALFLQWMEETSTVLAPEHLEAIALAAIMRHVDLGLLDHFIANGKLHAWTLLKSVPFLLVALENKNYVVLRRLLPANISAHNFKSFVDANIEALFDSNVDQVVCKQVEPLGIRALQDEAAKKIGVISPADLDNLVIERMMQIKSAESLLKGVEVHDNVSFKRDIVAIVGKLNIFVRAVSENKDVATAGDLKKLAVEKVDVFLSAAQLLQDTLSLDAAEFEAISAIDLAELAIDFLKSRATEMLVQRMRMAFEKSVCEQTLALVAAHLEAQPSHILPAFVTGNLVSLVDQKIGGLVDDDFMQIATTAIQKIQALSLIQLENNMRDVLAKPALCLDMDIKMRELTSAQLIELMGQLKDTDLEKLVTSQTSEWLVRNSIDTDCRKDLSVKEVYEIAKVIVTKRLSVSLLSRLAEEYPYLDFYEKNKETVPLAESLALLAVRYGNVPALKRMFQPGSRAEKRHENFLNEKHERTNLFREAVRWNQVAIAECLYREDFPDVATFNNIFNKAFSGSPHKKRTSNSRNVSARSAPASGPENPYTKVVVVPQGRGGASVAEYQSTKRVLFSQFQGQYGRPGQPEPSATKAVSRFFKEYSRPLATNYEDIVRIYLDVAALVVQKRFIEIAKCLWNLGFDFHEFVVDTIQENAVNALDVFKFLASAGVQIKVEAIAYAVSHSRDVSMPISLMKYAAIVEAVVNAKKSLKDAVQDAQKSRAEVARVKDMYRKMELATLGDPNATVLAVDLDATLMAPMDTSVASAGADSTVQNIAVDLNCRIGTLQDEVRCAERRIEEATKQVQVITAAADEAIEALSRPQSFSSDESSGSDYDSDESVHAHPVRRERRSRSPVENKFPLCPQDPENVIVFAAIAANKITIVDFIKNEGKYNFRNQEKNGFSAISYIINKGNVLALNAILCAEEDLLTLPENQVPYVMYATERKQWTIVQTLCQSNSEHAFQVREGGESLLVLCAPSEKESPDLMDCIFRIYQEKIQGVSLDAAGSLWNEPLVLKAARTNNVPLLQFLHRKGADFSTTDTEGMSVVAYALQENAGDALEFLLNKEIIADKQGFAEAQVSVAMTQNKWKVVRALVPYLPDTYKQNDAFFKACLVSRDIALALAVMRAGFPMVSRPKTQFILFDILSVIHDGLDARNHESADAFCMKILRLRDPDNVEIHKKDRRGLNWLMLAALEGNASLFRFLMGLLGRERYCRAEIGHTVLTMAAVVGVPEIIESIVNTPGLNREHINYRQAIISAALQLGANDGKRAQRLKCLSILMQYDPSKYKPAVKDTVSGYPEALYEFLRRDDVDAIAAMGKQGFIPWSGNFSFKTPNHIEIKFHPMVLAIRLGAVQAVQFFVKEFKLPLSGAEAAEPILFTAMGTPQKCVAMIQWLLENGADRGATDTNGQTAVIYAVCKGYSDALACLCQQIDSTIVNMQDMQGASALHYAVQANRLDMVRTLCSAGAKADDLMIRMASGPEQAAMLEVLRAVMEDSPKRGPREGQRRL